jgi:hypothetical protein
VAFRDQRVNSGPFQAEQPLHILETTEFRHDIGAVAGGHWLRGVAVFAHFLKEFIDLFHAIVRFHSVISKMLFRVYGKRAFCLSRWSQWAYDLFSMNRALTLDIKATSDVMGNTTLF